MHTLIKNNESIQKKKMDWNTQWSRQGEKKHETMSLRKLKFLTVEQDLMKNTLTSITITRNTLCVPHIYMYRKT